jgi:hypothetical protein
MSTVVVNERSHVPRLFLRLHVVEFMPFDGVQEFVDKNIAPKTAKINNNSEERSSVAK